MRNGWIGLAVMLLTACSNDGYNTGTGFYSLMRADFVDAHANSEGKVDYVITDDNDSLPILTPYSYSQIKIPSAFYRGVLYYNKVEGKKDSVAEVVSFSLVGKAIPQDVKRINKDSIFTDPVNFQSAWMSKNGKYLNLGINLLTGEADGNKSVQKLGVMEDVLTLLPNGRRCSELRLFHAQNGVPQYYTSRSFISVPLNYYEGKLMNGDSIVIRINTYRDGWVTKRFVMRK